MKLVFLFLCQVALLSCVSARCTEGEWRLWSAYNTTAPYEGIPQRCSQNGSWQGLCRYSGGCVELGAVLCKQVGFPHSIPYTYIFPSTDEFGEGNFSIYPHQLSCTGSEDTLEACSKLTSRYCPGTLQRDKIPAGVRCTPTAITFLSTPGCNDGDMRLVGGNSSNEGRAEYCHKGLWSPFCYVRGSKSFCKILGYQSESYYIFTKQEFGRSNVISPFRYFDRCPNDAISGRNCTLRTQGCTLKPLPCEIEYGVRCYNPGVCTNGEMRLAGGGISQMGRPEFCIDGLWSTLCVPYNQNPYYYYPGYSIMCKTLGYSGDANVQLTTNFGEGYWPRSFYFFCDRFYNMFFKRCLRRNSNINCYNRPPAGLLCYDNCKDTEVRLVNGPDLSQGTVEICVGHVWGHVSDKLWGANEATVVCRQLGFSTINGSEPVHGSSYGRPNRTVHINNIYCTGNENRLIGCRKELNPLEIGSSSYYKSVNVAGVRCKGSSMTGGSTVVSTPGTSTTSLSQATSVLATSTMATIQATSTSRSRAASSSVTGPNMPPRSTSVSNRVSSNTPDLLNTKSVSSHSTSVPPLATVQSQASNQDVNGATVYSIVTILGVTMVIVLVLLGLLTLFVFIAYKKKTSNYGKAKDDVMEGIANPVFET